MKTKLFTLLLAVAASVGTMFAEKVQIGDLYYNLDATNQTAEVTYKSYTNYNYKYNEGWGITTANIPASVTYNSVTYSVTSIGNSAFDGCTGLTSVTIPGSVTSIGEDAFDGCSGLKSVTIPNSVTSIEGGAFSDCSSLTSVTIPNSVTSIGNSAFYGCSGLTSVTIPNSVTSIGIWAFYYCSSLSSVTIPNSVTSIGDAAFSGCRSLTSVTIPNSVTSIGREAFGWCTGLTSLSVEAGNTVYDSRNNCNAIIETSTNTLISGCQNTTIPNSVTSIGDYAFYCCTDLTSVEIPNSVTSIGRGAFAGCSGLTSLNIGNSVTSIGEYAFHYCSSLSSVTIPNSVTSIGEYAFYECKGLTSVIWNAKNCADFTYNNSPFFNNDHDYSSFDLRNQITSFIFGSEVEHIPANLCSGMSNLTSVTMEAETPPTLGSGAFDNTNNCPIYVPCGTLDAYKTAWSYSSRITHSPFQECIYTISTTSANPEWGTTTGDTSALYLDNVEISAIPNYGYHFVRWNDNNRSNPRTVSVTEDKTYTATFAKYIFSITKNAEHGTISGNSSAEYLDFVTLTVTPDYGYHFTQWSDGLKDNPRIFQITKDTTFTAEFAYDRVGTCGKDLALVWSYDPTNKVLTIGNAGSFTENMQFGVEAPNEMEELVIGNSVTAIGANAFAGIETLKKVSIGESVKTIGEQAFYNCMNLETIFNYRPTPTNTYSNAFDGVDKFECVLYVLPSSIDMYKNAAVWRDFYYTYAIGAEEATVTTNDVQVEPQDNAVVVTWPVNNEAASYTIEITKDGEVFCRLVFNANGQLTGIAFAPSPNGTPRHAPTALMTANGMQFTVTGLNSNTNYGYSVTTKDANDQPIASYSGEFSTTGEVPTSVDQVPSDQVQSTKFLRNGQILILRGDKTYTVTGQEVK